MIKFLVGLAGAALMASSVAGCAADSALDDEPTSESQDHLLTGRLVSQGETANLLRQADFPESSIGKMVCTAKYESSFYERASNHNGNGSNDYGLFQINSVHLGKPGCPSNASGLYNAAANTKCALAVYKSSGLNAWYGYRNHKWECDRFPAPTSAGRTAVPTTPTPAGNGDTTSSSSSSSGSSGTNEAGGGCYSATMKDMVDGGTCIESRFDSAWMQCHDGLWYRGVSGNRGQFGACTSVHPL